MDIIEHMVKEYDHRYMKKHLQTMSIGHVSDVHSKDHALQDSLGDRGRFSHTHDEKGEVITKKGPS